MAHVCTDPRLCSSCQATPSAPVIGSQLRYYPFHETWDKLFVPCLKDVKVVAVKTFVLEQIRLVLSDPSYVERYIPLTAFREAFIPLFREAKTPQEQRELIDDYAWGIFSPILVPSDAKLYPVVARHEYGEATSLGHYLYIHYCQLIALLLWTWLV